MLLEHDIENHIPLPLITTTLPPPTTSTSAPITTEKPKPKEPQPGTWVANYTDTNRTCIMVEFAAQLEIPYSISNMSAANSYSEYVNVPPDAIVNATCDCDTNQTTQKIELSWNAVTNASNKFTLTFEKLANTTKFDLASVEVSIFPDNASFAKDQSKYQIRCNLATYQF